LVLFTFISANKKEVIIVREGIHPKYEKSIIKCACGEIIETKSTKKELHIDICSKCHPFFTGKQKLIDTGGRIDRFKKKFNLE
jgi:large subunit ribosomal protein L31